MSNEITKQNDLNQLEEDDMRPEYDFGQAGDRGKAEVGVVCHRFLAYNKCCSVSLICFLR